MAKESRKQDPIITKAMRDPAFRQRLLSDPKAALKAEFGTDVPADINLHVHEETATDLHIVLPKEVLSGDGEMADSELELAVGGMMAGGPGATSQTCTCGTSTNQTLYSRGPCCGRSNY